MQNVSIPSETITLLSSLTSIKIALIGKFEHLDSQSQKTIPSTRVETSTRTRVDVRRVPGISGLPGYLV